MSVYKPVFFQDAYKRLIDETFETIKKLSDLKGGEYAADVDCLVNFRRNAEKLKLTKEQVWGVYANKHWDALMQYIQDVSTGQSRERAEPPTSRVDDLIVYLLLMKAMITENNLDEPLEAPEYRIKVGAVTGHLAPAYGESPAAYRARVNVPWYTDEELKEKALKEQMELNKVWPAR